MSSMASIFLDKSGIPEAEAVKEALVKRMNRVGIEEISVIDVEVDMEGDITVTFQDDEGDVMDVIFSYDPEDGPIALIADEGDEDNWLIVDLDGLHPTLVKTPVGIYLNLTDLEWMNKSAFLTLFEAGNLDDDDDGEKEVESKKGYVQPELYGYLDVDGDLEEATFEVDEARKVFVVRGGKRVKLAIVRKIKRRILTGKQKQSIRKAVRKRKAKKHIIARKRKKSLRVRRRLKIKRPTNLSRTQKVAGTGNRK